MLQLARSALLCSAAPALSTHTRMRKRERAHRVEVWLSVHRQRPRPYVFLVVLLFLFVFLIVRVFAERRRVWLLQPHAVVRAGAAARAARVLRRARLRVCVRACAAGGGTVAHSGRHGVHQLGRREV